MLEPLGSRDKDEDDKDDKEEDEVERKAARGPPGFHGNQ